MSLLLLQLINFGLGGPDFILHQIDHLDTFVTWFISKNFLLGLAATGGRFSEGRLVCSTSGGTVGAGSWMV